MRISDWSSDVCSSDLYEKTFRHLLYPGYEAVRGRRTLPYLREHEASQWLPPGQTGELQWRKLTPLVGTCWEQVPSYRQLCQKIAFAPGDLDRRVQRLNSSPKCPPLIRLFCIKTKNIQ